MVDEVGNVFGVLCDSKIPTKISTRFFKSVIRSIMPCGIEYRTIKK